MGDKPTWDDPSPPSSPIPMATVPIHGRLSVAMQRKPSLASGPNLGQLNINAPHASRRARVVLGRPTRVFWDLETCPIAGPDYFGEIIKSIEQRVQIDTRMENFEIYASYESVSHLSSELCIELLNYDVNFNLARPDPNADETFRGAHSAVEYDLFQQITRFVETQSRQTNLFPYVLLISGNVSLINRMQNLEKCCKIVYAVRKEKTANFHVGNLAYEYSAAKGIDNHRP